MLSKGTPSVKKRDTFQTFCLTCNASSDTLTLRCSGLGGVHEKGAEATDAEEPEAR